VTILKNDDSIWEIVSDLNHPGRYRIISYTGLGLTARVIATDLSLDVTVQICDEHIMVGNIIESIRNRENATLSLSNGEILSRSPL
jgi:hypothetical protein